MDVGPLLWVGGDSPGPLGNGAQGHGLLDLCQREHHGEAGERGKTRVAHVVVGEVVERLLAGKFDCKDSQREREGEREKPISTLEICI